MKINFEKVMLGLIMIVSVIICIGSIALGDYVVFWGCINLTAVTLVLFKLEHLYDLIEKIKNWQNSTDVDDDRK